LAQPTHHHHLPHANLNAGSRNRSIHTRRKEKGKKGWGVGKKRGRRRLEEGKVEAAGR